MRVIRKAGVQIFISFPRSSVGTHTLMLQRQELYTGRWSVQYCIPTLERGNEVELVWITRQNPRNQTSTFPCIPWFNFFLLVSIQEGQPCHLIYPY